ncbi:pyruvate ferredoxin oxidoreductase [Eggerthellaceae bacterium zg-887]|uniref:indolepyruvate oxidoreductase subunit beta n=1 Tax=Xiamenia xianingshaonis TaxID=2682776 RepID=UPI0014095CDA|nr:indolepyruvate oxidoreductase subunit beta [Xiamenia xianingshaonis]NHM15781.1 pyruvate ferredoxin oxidoreductase [Xiamenia xianingshaonis]
MINILLAGVGGQGTVLAAKVLAQAALEKGWQVRTAETIGMAQRGGNVVSHVRMGSDGEEVLAPLVAEGTADVIVAFEPAEAARVLPYLAPTGVLVTATTPLQPVTAALAKHAYRAEEIVGNIAASLEGSQATFVPVDDAALCSELGSRKALNTLMLASALSLGRVPLSLDDLRSAIRACVKPRFVDLNLQAIEVAAGRA